jgi:hypothetical protein
MSLLEIDRPLINTSSEIKKSPTPKPGKKSSEINHPPTEIIDKGMDTVIKGASVVEPLFDTFYDPKAAVPITKDTTVGAIMEELKDSLGFEHTDANGSRKVFVKPVLIPPTTKIGTQIDQIEKVDLSDIKKRNNIREVAYRVEHHILGPVNVYRAFRPGKDVFISPLNKK